MKTGDILYLVTNHKLLLARIIRFTAHEAYRPECMTVECVPKVSVMIWGCVTWYGVGTLCQVNGNINAEKYISVLESITAGYRPSFSG